jgi:hypothetical protein
LAINKAHTFRTFLINEGFHTVYERFPTCKHLRLIKTPPGYANIIFKTTIPPEMREYFYLNIV